MATINRRKPEKAEHYEVRYYVGRKKEMERINKENKQIAGRLAEFYNGKSMHVVVGGNKTRESSQEKLPNIAKDKI